MIVLWTGPISAQMMAPAVPPGCRLVTINAGANGKIGSTAFAQLGSSYGGDLAAVLKSRGVTLGAEPVVLAAFSAGWGLVETILARDPTRPAALLAADAYYTGAGVGRKPGFAAFCALAAAGQKLAVFTTSPIAGATHPSAEEAVGALLAPFGMQPCSPPPGLGEPRPEAVVCQRGIVWARYSRALGHGKHGSVLAQQWMRAAVLPYMRGAPSGGQAGGGGDGIGWLAALGALGAGLGWFG